MRPHRVAGTSQEQARVAEVDGQTAAGSACLAGLVKAGVAAIVQTQEVVRIGVSPSWWAGGWSGVPGGGQTQEVVRIGVSPSLRTCC